MRVPVRKDLASAFETVRTPNAPTSAKAGNRTCRKKTDFQHEGREGNEGNEVGNSQPRMHTNLHEFGADVFSRMNTDWRRYRKFSSTRIYFFTGEHWRIPSTPFRNQLLINPFVLPRVSNQIGNQPPLCPLIRNPDSPAEDAIGNIPRMRSVVSFASEMRLCPQDQPQQ